MWFVSVCVFRDVKTCFGAAREGREGKTEDAEAQKFPEGMDRGEPSPQRASFTQVTSDSGPVMGRKP